MNIGIRLLAVFLSLHILGLRVFSQDKKNENVKIEVTGKIKGDYRFFPEKGLYAEQETGYFSAQFQPEMYAEFNEGKQLIQFTGFAVLDQFDTKRTHWDLREFYFQTIASKWELSIGVKKIFWGVTESNHLVDVINQIDVLEGFDVENKLGQPMVHFSYLPNWGTIDFMVMPFFRQMQFPGIKGRLRPPFEIDNSLVSYESKMENYNPDIVLRWSHGIDVFDIGISHFYGTSRLPLFLIENDFQSIILYHEIINQTGIDLQASKGSMLWKIEFIHRRSKRKTVTALTVGGEYTFSNVLQSGTDIGLIAEYNFDDRGKESINALNDDFFFGTRIAFNDRQSSDFIAGVIIDRNNGTTRAIIKINRRVGDSWKVSLNAAGFKNVSDSEFLYLFRNDQYLQFSLAKYF